eukprot:4359848-Prymnesium_polylepis.4
MSAWPSAIPWRRTRACRSSAAGVSRSAMPSVAADTHCLCGIGHGEMISATPATASSHDEPRSARPSEALSATALASAWHSALGSMRLPRSCAAPRPPHAQSRPRAGRPSWQAGTRKHTHNHNTHTNAHTHLGVGRDEAVDAAYELLALLSPCAAVLHACDEDAANLRRRSRASRQQEGQVHVVLVAGELVVPRPAPPAERRRRRQREFPCERCGAAAEAPRVQHSG